MEGFEGLSSAFNVENIASADTVEELQNQIQLIENKKNLLVQQKNNNAIIFQDQKFIQTEVRSLIAATRAVMVKLEQNLKIGSPAREFEVYAKLVDSVGNQYKSLLDLNKAVFDAQVETNQIDINNVGNKKISLTSDQLLDLVDKARDESQMNAIEADFTIDDANENDVEGGVNSVSR